ncbi:protein transport protein SEC16, putative [Plasmodium vivax]|uniref:Protein transport protein SEC16, putative n=1 Tax=Plasmodium vivax TaxID=5855 RepID=A0A564ZUS0_PLAVI|nr:protein transport protein SEC16, putative [Plasmodium vivax]
MEEHLFSYENIFRNKDLNIDEEIREKNQKEKGQPVEGVKGPPGDGDPEEESPRGSAKKVKIEPGEEGKEDEQNKPDEQSKPGQNNKPGEEGPSNQPGAADESKTGEKDDTSPGGDGRPSEADCKGGAVEAEEEAVEEAAAVAMEETVKESVEEASTEVTSMMNVTNVTNATNATHTADAADAADTAQEKSRTEPQTKKKTKNDVSSLFADSPSEVPGAGGDPPRDNNEVNFWFSGEGAAPHGQANGSVNGSVNGAASAQAGEKGQARDNRLEVPLGSNPDGATNVKRREGEDGGSCGMGSSPSGVDASISGCNEEKQIRSDGGDVPDWTPQVSSSDLVGDASPPGCCEKGPSEEGADAPGGGTSEAVGGNAAGGNAAGGNAVGGNAAGGDAAGGDAAGGDAAGGDAAGGDAAGDNAAGDATTTTAAIPTTLCFGTNGTFCYTRGRKVKCAPLICILESGIRVKSEGSSGGSRGGTAASPPLSSTSGKHSSTIGGRDNRLEEHIYAIRNFPGPFSRRSDRVDKKVLNFLHGHMSLNEELYGNNVYECTQKNCVYKYLVNVMRNPQLLAFNLKDVRVERSGAKPEGGEKGRSAASYALVSPRHHHHHHHDHHHHDHHHQGGGDPRASENNPREELEDRHGRGSPPDVGERSALNSNRAEMDKFEITWRGAEKREPPLEGDTTWGVNAICGETPSFSPAATWRDANQGEAKGKKKKVLIQNQQYQFDDVVDPNFIKTFSQMGMKEKITREDVYQEYYHLCIYDSEKAARVCVEKNLFKHFFLVLKKYNGEMYRLMLSKYIKHIGNSMSHDIEVTDGLKNIFRIYNPNVHNSVVKEAFVFLISLLHRESMSFERDLLIDHWYVFYILVYHNFLFQFEENDLDYQDYRDDIGRFFSFLVRQLYTHGRVTEAQFLHLQLCGNPCVFSVAAGGRMHSGGYPSHVPHWGGYPSYVPPLEERPHWGGPLFDVLTFHICEVMEYLNRSHEDNFFYEDLIGQKIKYAFTLLELGVLEQAKKYVEITFYYVDVIRSQKTKNTLLVHLYESLLSQAKYVLPSRSLQPGGGVPTNWPASSEDLPAGGVYNYKVVSPHQGGGAIGGSGSGGSGGSSGGIGSGGPPPNEQLRGGQSGPREGDPYHVPFYQQPSGHVAMTPFGAKNPSGFNPEQVGSAHEGVITGSVSHRMGSNPSSPPHMSGALTTNQSIPSEGVGSYSHFGYPPPPHSIAANADQSSTHHGVFGSGASTHHDAFSSGMSVTHHANAPYPTDGANPFLPSYHPQQVVASGGAEYPPVEGGSTPYQQYGGAYQNGSAQTGYFYGGGESLAGGAAMSSIPDGGNAAARSYQQVSNACNDGYAANWGGTPYGGTGSSPAGQSSFAYYYDASGQVVYPAAAQQPPHQAAYHTAQQAPHQAAHQGAHQGAYTAQQAPHQAAHQGAHHAAYTAQQAPHQSAHPPDGTDNRTESQTKKQTDQPQGENNIDLINMGKTFISGFLSNIKEKIKMSEQAEEEEEENIFYYDYERKRWREKGVTSDEERERDRQKMQREMEIKNVAPPPLTENLAQTNKKNPLDIKDVRSRYVDYFS